MAKESSLVRLVEPVRPPHRARLTADQARPFRPIELVSDEERRHDEQTAHKAELPKDFFKKVPVMEPPLVPGATVNLESLLGFLAAMEMILPPESNYPILSSAKITYEPATAKLFIEAGSHAVWTVVALQVISGTDKGFTAAMPISRAKNVLLSLRDLAPTIVVGVDDHGVCLGPHTVPFGGMIDDFPDQPEIHDWVARAAMPAFYFKEVVARVLPARSTDFADIALHGTLIDFEFHEIDGAMRPLCTVVATDGSRIHILRLPRMMIEVKPTRMRALPPTCTVSAGFFAYMKEIIQHEWAALELADDQVVARGPDFIVVAKAASEGRSSLDRLASWRKVNVDWGGYWLASSTKLLELVKAARLNGTADECRLQIDRARETLSIMSIGSDGDRYSSAIPVRSFDGAAIVDVKFSIQFLIDAIDACTSGLVRLAFNHDPDVQATAPLVIRGEDEQFKAIVMPRE